MMTPVEYTAKVKRFNDWLKNQFYRDALVVGSLQMAVDIRHRVEQKGQTSTGGSFKPYSTRTTLVGAKSFTTKSAWDKVYSQAKSTREINAAIHWITLNKTNNSGKKIHLIVLPGGYTMIRKLEGRQTTFKSFNRTGFMWRGFGIKAKQQPMVVLGGTKPESQNKINWNSAREKENIIMPSNAEIHKLADFCLKKVMEAMK